MVYIVYHMFWSIQIGDKNTMFRKKLLVGYNTRETPEGSLNNFFVTFLPKIGFSQAWTTKMWKGIQFFVCYTPIGYRQRDCATTICNSMHNLCTVMPFVCPFCQNSTFLLHVTITTIQSSSITWTWGTFAAKKLFGNHICNSEAELCKFRWISWKLPWWPTSPYMGSHGYKPPSSGFYRALQGSGTNSKRPRWVGIVEPVFGNYPIL